MEEQLISFETAKLAKEKGFKPNREWNPEYVNGYIEDEGIKFTQFKEEDYNCDGYYLAPTQSLLQKWLREVHKLDIDIFYVAPIDLNEQCHWELFGIFDMIGRYKFNIKDIYYLSYPTYEEALEVGLQEGLKLIK